MKAIPCVVESKWSRRLFSALRVKPDRSSYVARAVHIVIAIKFGACQRAQSEAGVQDVGSSEPIWRSQSGGVRQSNRAEQPRQSNRVAVGGSGWQRVAAGGSAWQ